MSATAGTAMYSTSVRWDSAYAKQIKKSAAPATKMRCHCFLRWEARLEKTHNPMPSAIQTAAKIGKRSSERIAYPTNQANGRRADGAPAPPAGRHGQARS